MVHYYNNYTPTCRTSPLSHQTSHRFFFVVTILLLLSVNIIVPHVNAAIQWTSCDKFSVDQNSNHMSSSSPEKNHLDNLRHVWHRFHRDSRQHHVAEAIRQYITGNSSADTPPVPYLGIPHITRMEKTRNLAANEDMQTQCANVQVPLNWNEESNSEQITLFVKRYAVRTRSVKKGQVWLLEGGPGAPGTALEPYGVDLFNRLNGEYDIYIPDHRGTGRSNYLNCPLNKDQTISSREDFDQCSNQIESEWGDDTQWWKTTGAALDVKQIMEETRASSDNVVVYGVSYGTYWAHRILQVAGEIVDASILDGVVPPNRVNLFEWDPNFNNTGTQLLEICQANDFCRDKFEDRDSTAFQTLQSVYQEFRDNTQCDIFSSYSYDEFKQLISSMLTNRGTRLLLLPLVYRLERCSNRDKNAIERLAFGLTFNGAPRVSFESSSKPKFSDVLNFHIGFSELVQKPYTTELEARTFFEEASFATGSSIFSARGVRGWNAIYSDPLEDQYAEYDKPLLVMNGNLDPQTPASWAQYFVNHINASNLEYVEVPQAPHFVVGSSPVEQTDDNGDLVHCGMLMLSSFINNLDGTVDKSCLENLRQLDFQGTDELADQYFGSDSLWEGGPLLSVTEIIIIVVCLVFVVILCIGCACIAVGVYFCTQRRKTDHKKAARDSTHETLYAM